LDCAGQNIDDRARNAIGILKIAISRIGPYRSIDFNDLALHATIRAFGGWVELCDWTGEMWDINEGRFVASYKAAVNSGIAGPEYLAGISDTHNSAIGKNASCDVPVLVGYQNGLFIKQLSDKKYVALKIDQKNDPIKMIEDISRSMAMPK
jgi:hypothetical protein